MDLKKNPAGPQLVLTKSSVQDVKRTMEVLYCQLGYKCIKMNGKILKNPEWEIPKRNDVGKKSK